MIADLDTLLTALYVELTDRIIPARGFTRRGPGGRPAVTDAELACIAVAQVLLRFDDERHWLRTAPRLIGRLFPRLLSQGEYNLRLRRLAPLMEAALRWLADATPATAELLRLMDATPIPCGASAVTARRSDLYGYAGYGYCASHSRWYWGCKLLLICTCDGTVTGFSLANPKLHGERDQARQTLERQPANRPAPGSAVVTDKGLSGQGTEDFFAGEDLRPDPDPPRPQGRETAPAVPELAPPARRGDHLDPEEPARPRAPRRPHPRRPVDPHHPAAPGPQRGHLAQLADRRPAQALPDRLRPHLTCPHSPINDLVGVTASLCGRLGAWRPPVGEHSRRLAALGAPGAFGAGPRVAAPKARARGLSATPATGCPVCRLRRRHRLSGSMA